MGLDVDKGTIILDPLVGMSGVSVHLVIAIRGAAVREKDHDLMDGLRVLGEVVLQLLYQQPS